MEEQNEAMELAIYQPTISEDGQITIGGNFDVLKAQAQALVDKYKGLVLTDSNVQVIKTAKSNFVMLRNGIDRKRKEWKKIYIQTPSKLVDAACDELQAVIAEGETALGAQLDAYDAERKEEITIVLSEYAENAIKEAGLRPEYAAKVVLREKYYNKTQKEEDSLDDIDAQIAEQVKAQNDYDLGVKLICTECEASGLSSAPYIRQLNTKSAMEVLLEIKQDAAATKIKTSASETVSDIAAIAAEEEETKEVTFRIRYKVSQGALINKFFADLGIRVYKA